jgi:hypothetical protein
VPVLPRGREEAAVGRVEQHDAERHGLVHSGGTPPLRSTRGSRTSVMATRPQCVEGRVP